MVQVTPALPELTVQQRLPRRHTTHVDRAAGFGQSDADGHVVVNGLKDTLVSAADALLLLKDGEPKSAWLNLEGIDLGRYRTWNDDRIMDGAIVP